MNFNGYCIGFQLLLSPDAPYFKISTDGLAGDCHIEVPHDSELVDSFECKANASSCYKLAHIKPAMKALSCGNKVSIRTDDCGLLCFQYMVRTEEGHTCFIEYFVRFQKILFSKNAIKN